MNVIEGLIETIDDQVDTQNTEQAFWYVMWQYNELNFSCFIEHFIFLTTTAKEDLWNYHIGKMDYPHFTWDKYINEHTISWKFFIG